MATNLRTSESAHLTAIKLPDGSVQVTAGCQTLSLDARDLEILQAAAEHTNKAAGSWTSDRNRTPATLGHKVKQDEVAVFVINATPEWLAAHNLALGDQSSNVPACLATKAVLRLIYKEPTDTYTESGYNNTYTISNQEA